ncbi:uncharacterized protein LOC125682114 isoform X2 [Ostrea edulis]|uniref:uncharacterized protein LOC125682114 isoform X2 n=1 Tax=Ostrea edulis TaxID=37623 RepID=UPI0024AE910D|nr:uncharacterized protein LOC125682114 isoform X2 [Ostrea edulis]XP_056016117.1 uncharacterized protein LOC125682114 isoform X2 [Ostrea edulis]
MASLCLLSVLCIVLLCSAEAAQQYKVVSACPRDETSWRFESNRKKCQEPTPDYLCAAMENWVGHFGEICTKYGLSPKNKCAVLNNQTYNLDSVDCKAPSNCPDKPYSPGELWKYQICYQNFYGTTPTPAVTTTKEMTTIPPNSSPDDGGSGGAVAAVVVVVVLLLIVVIVVLLVWMYRRNQWGSRDKLAGWRSRLPFGRGDESTGARNRDVEKPGQIESEALLKSGEGRPAAEQNKEDLPMYSKVVKKDKSKTTDDATIMKKRIEKLKTLQKYLVHILKKEISVTDLKEKSIIHSKSLREHIEEPLRKDLQSVKTSDDYSTLDMSLVFVLLRNFCPNIKPPTKGWDYEPPDTERTVGADIERIRQMWNKYCDNNCEFKDMDDVFNRMKQKYGTLAVEESNNTSSDEKESFENVKDKIQSIKLNPDCVVDHGIVITEGVKTALQLLTTKNVVICRGAIGCGKTHALRAIQKKYEEKGWKSKWMEKILLEEIHDEKTLVVCDNMFGRFGCNTFSSKQISKIENLLEKMSENQEGSIKVVVGIHQHVFDEVKKNNQWKFLQNKNNTVELDKQSEAETLLIFKEQQKRGHCHKNPNCWFRNIDFASVSAKLSLSQGHIGSPFLSWMYCCHHELFSEDAFSKAPLENLSSRFQKMKTDSSELYYTLVYIMCVGKHSHGNELESFAGHIEATLVKDSVENAIRTTPGYFKVDNNTVTLVHEVLTIALFKAVAKVEEDLRPVYENCELETILQLMRPAEEHQSEFAHGFDYPQQKTKARYLGKILVNRCIVVDTDGKKWVSVDHPLNKHELFIEKYPNYPKKKLKEK